MNLDMKINMVIQFIIKKIENRMELLLIKNGDKLQDTKSHVYIKKSLKYLCTTKQSIKTNSIFYELFTMLWQ